MIKSSFFVLTCIALAGCAEAKSTSTASSSNIKVTASRVDGNVEFRVSAGHSMTARAYDPVLVVSGHKVAKFKYEDRDRTLVFVEPNPASLEKTSQVTLQWGAGPANPPVQSQDLPFDFDPNAI
jgi:hypothetical protein